MFTHPKLDAFNIAVPILVPCVVAAIFDLREFGHEYGRVEQAVIFATGPLMLFVTVIPWFFVKALITLALRAVTVWPFLSRNTKQKSALVLGTIVNMGVAIFIAFGSLIVMAAVMQ